MKLITGIGGWPEEAGPQAVKAEENGYDMVTCGELSHDSILTMTLAANATKKIELQTSVTIAFPRSPMVLAMEAWDIQRLVEGPVPHRSWIAGERPQRASLRRQLERSCAAHEGIHPDDEGHLGVLAGWRAGGVHRQGVPLHADDAELQSGSHRLSQAQGLPGGGWTCHGQGGRRGGGWRAATRWHHDRQVHARDPAAEREDRPGAFRSDLG